MKFLIYDWNLTQEFDLIGQVIIPVEALIANPVINEWYPLKSMDGGSVAKGELKVHIKFCSATERSELTARFRRSPTTFPAFVRSDFNFYSPVGQVSFFGRILLRGKCGFCGQHRRDHENDLRCNLGTGNYVHSIDVSCDGSLVAWGTGDGRIRIATVGTAERVACWTAHAGPVLGLCFSKWDLRLLSWGVDHRHAKPSDLVRGAYAPKKASQASQDRANVVVESWYVGSLLEDRERWIRKKNSPNRSSLQSNGSAENVEAGVPKDDAASTAGTAGPESEGVPGSVEDDDDDDSLEVSKIRIASKSTSV